MISDIDSKEKLWVIGIMGEWNGGIMDNNLLAVLFLPLFIL
jgi:hypothetical protein